MKQKSGTTPSQLIKSELENILRPFSYSVGVALAAPLILAATKNNKLLKKVEQDLTCVFQFTCDGQGMIIRWLIWRELWNCLLHEKRGNLMLYYSCFFIITTVFVVVLAFIVSASWCIGFNFKFHLMVIIKQAVLLVSTFLIIAGFVKVCDKLIGLYRTQLDEWQLLESELKQDLDQARTNLTSTSFFVGGYVRLNTPENIPEDIQNIISKHCKRSQP